MTKKHFRALAAAIETVVDNDKRVEFHLRIGNVCATFNSEFDWQQWMAACGVTDEQINAYWRSRK